MTLPLKRRGRALGLAAASALVLTAASVFGLASAAQADYVSPDDLSSDSNPNWSAVNGYGSDDDVAPEFAECSIVFGEDGGFLGYEFSEGAEPTGIDEVTGILQGFAVSVTEGGGTITVRLTRDLAGGEGFADIDFEIPVGVSGIDFDAEVELADYPSLDLSETPTVQEVLDALDASGDEFSLFGFEFFSETASEVQWLAFGSETYWFGTDAEWFLNDPSCGTAVPDPEPTPTPTKPVRVETGL
ncbi:MAG: hypothetical protein ACTHZ9_03765 [Leucobacter sp.]